MTYRIDGKLIAVVAANGHSLSGDAFDDAVMAYKLK
jgi:hypothetical protein